MSAQFSPAIVSRVRRVLESRPSPMRQALVKVARRLLRAGGLDVVRWSAPRPESLLGLTRFRVRTVFDIGANAGQFAKVALDTFPEAIIYSFEPLDEPYRELTRWQKESDAKRVVPVKLALGDKTGEFEMRVHTQYSGSSSFLESTPTCHRLFPFTAEQESYRVRMTTLDAFLAAEASEPPLEWVLKLDVQGFEDRVLGGAGTALARARACVVEVSLDPLYEGQAHFRGLVQLLEDAGLRYAGNWHQELAPDGHVVFIDAVFLR